MTTSIDAKNIDALNGEDCLVAKSNQNFADSACMLLEDEEQGK